MIRSIIDARTTPRILFFFFFYRPPFCSFKAHVVLVVVVV
jgi:hypothetical protein